MKKQIKLVVCAVAAALMFGITGCGGGDSADSIAEKYVDCLKEADFDGMKEFVDFWNSLFSGREFRLRKFFNELATGTGVGLRYDLDFLVLRVDWGFGLHLPYDTGHGGYFNIPRFKDMHTLHIAIGYPF